MNPIYPTQIQKNAMKNLHTTGVIYVQGLSSNAFPASWLSEGITTFHTISEEVAGILAIYYEHLEDHRIDKRVMHHMAQAVTDANALSQSLYKMRKAVQAHYTAQMEQEKTGVAPLQAGRR